MSEENVELALRAVHAWKEGGAQAILPYLDPEIDWHPPRESMEPETFVGKLGSVTIWIVWARSSPERQERSQSRSSMSMRSA